MSNTREGRITPLAWYTLGEYKLYFVNLGKWYAKIFLRKGKPTKTPHLTFEADSKIELMQKIDDHCLKTFGKIFRYKKLAHQEPMLSKPTVSESKKNELQQYATMNFVEKQFDEQNKQLLKMYCDGLYKANHINQISVIGVMLSALIVVMIMVLTIVQ